MESVDKNCICRLCLLDSDDFTNIFDVYVRNGFVAADLIKDLLQFNVSTADGYSPVVCRPCLCNLTNFKHFKEQCITSKATYDNVFPLNEEILDSTLKLDVATIKEEEVDVDFTSDVRSIGQIEEDVTKVSCGPILLKYEVLSFNRDDNPQESDVCEEEDIEQTSNGSEDKSSQECEDPLRGVSDEEANCEASTTALMIERGKSNSEVEKCRDVQINEANIVKCFGEHRTYKNKRKEQLQGIVMASCSRSKRSKSTDEDYIPGLEFEYSDTESIDLGSEGSSSEDDLSSVSDSDIEGCEDNIDDCRNWFKVNMENIHPPPPRFPFTSNPGITININPDSRPFEYFELFFDKTMLEIIVKETNRFAEQHKSKHIYKNRSRCKNWTSTTEKEIRLFLAILMLQGIIKMPLQDWSWSKRRILHVPIFAELMTQERFLLIMKFLHFCDNDEINKGNHPNPKLIKIYDVMEHLRGRFCDIYIPVQTLSLDESLMLFKGRLGWKMYNANKRARFGLKFFMLCESESGYICDFLLYTGKGTVYNRKYDSLPISTKTVLHLMDRFLGKGYCVTVDNWFMSPQLADLLVEQKTDIYGTLNSRRKDLTQGFAKEKPKKEKIQAFQRGKVVALRWQDKNTICLTSAVHNTSSRNVKTRKGMDGVKPTVVCDHSNTVSGVDRCDQELSHYPSVRKQQKKYYKKIFIHFIDQAVWNSYILYTKVSSQKPIGLVEYRLRLIEDAIAEYADPNFILPKERPSATPSPLRLTARHFARHIPPNIIKKEPRRQCAVCCSKKDENGKRMRKETRIWCRDCGVGLCLEPCFIIYHTEKTF